MVRACKHWSTIMEHMEHALLTAECWTEHSLRKRESPKLVERLGRWAASWHAEFQQARTLRLIARAVGNDDHLLRDIGFDRDGDRIIPVANHFGPRR
jgi:hypothetical protein